MFIQMDLNLRHRKWLELLKDYDMSMLYHPDKANVAADALSHMNMGSMYHVEEFMKDLLKDAYMLARLGVPLDYSPTGGLMVH